jgi:zinc transporter, ZIP family
MFSSFVRASITAICIFFLSARTDQHILGILMLFCSGGILYLIFDDIAPRAHLKHHDFPAVGAVSGFLLGLVGTMLIH